MQDYSINSVFQTLWYFSRIIIDIGIVWYLVHYFLKISKNNARTIQIFKGIFLFIIFHSIAKTLDLTALTYLMGIFLNWGFLAIIIIFQPEIRGMLERIGKSNPLSKFNTLLANEKVQLADNIYEACILIAKSKSGALITIEQSQSLEDYIKKATLLNSEVSIELLVSIFMTTTPLHDGAVIIQGNKIACASAYFPSSSEDLSNRYGARHRAALGISEVSDSVTIVISEETSEISLCQKGQITKLGFEELKKQLRRIICDEEIIIDKKLLINDEKDIIDRIKMPFNNKIKYQDQNEERIIIDALEDEIISIDDLRE